MDREASGLGDSVDDDDELLLDATESFDDEDINNDDVDGVKAVNNVRDESKKASSNARAAPPRDLGEVLKHVQTPKPKPDVEKPEAPAVASKIKLWSVL
jgi:hypothetical protein